MLRIQERGTVLFFLVILDFYLRHEKYYWLIRRIMRKYDKKMKQGIFDDEKYIREHTHLVRPPRLQPEQKEGMMQPVKKPKGTNGKGSIPSM